MEVEAGLSFASIAGVSKAVACSSGEGNLISGVMG